MSTPAMEHAIRHDAAFLLKNLTEVEAADQLGVSVGCMRNWRLRGGGPAYNKIGRAVRYRRADLIAFTDAGRQEAHA